VLGELELGPLCGDGTEVLKREPAGALVTGEREHLLVERDGEIELAPLLMHDRLRVQCLGVHAVELRLGREDGSAAGRL
jgi:hypothetical protein